MSINNQVFNTESRLVQLNDNILVQTAGIAASLVANGITYTADATGTAGNSITITIVGGGTAGSEVVNVTGTDIEIEIQNGVSTRTQVKTALDNSVDAAALISVSVTSGATAASLLAETALSGGAAAVLLPLSRDFQIVESSEGIFTITLNQKYEALLGCSIMLLRATAAHLMPMMQSVNMTTGVIVFRIQQAANIHKLNLNDQMFITLNPRSNA